MNIGRSIRILRQQKKLTQEQLASGLGVSYQAVSKWETESNTPDIALLPKIANLLDTSIDALFSDDPLAFQISDLRQIKDDDVIRIIQLRGKKLLNITDRPSPNDPPIEIVFPRNCNQQTQYFKVEVYGHVIADGSINGDVICHQTVSAHEINACGNVICKTISECHRIQCSTLECSGNIAAANLTCNQISDIK
ncbi:MAG: helix-turn-helix transcriptional regulator [Clostridia bacterium]|nr:helix-turn-helix transcriptional regulator [Clostridia bacterium]